MTSGKLDAVKLILINLVKYLLLYQKTEKKKRMNYYEEEEEEEEEERVGRVRLLSVIDGQLKRSRKAPVKVTAETIAPLSLSQLKIFNPNDLTGDVKGGGVGGRANEEDDADAEGINEEDDYDALFSQDFTLDYESDFSITDQADTHMDYDKIDITDTEGFTLELADKLSSILQYTSLPYVSDLDQVRLLAIAQTVAAAKDGKVGVAGGADLGTTTGAGYASVGTGGGGVIGGASMDECGMRYLLALQNYITLSNSLPQGLAPLEVATSDLIWAFHSDAETELLSSIPCVREDRLNWSDLRSAGVSLWVRSNDTLRKLAEKVEMHEAHMYCTCNNSDFYSCIC